MEQFFNYVDVKFSEPLAIILKKAMVNMYDKGYLNEAKKS
jgi:hypothetical protein